MAFPDFRERKLADENFGCAFREHHQKQLIDPAGESFVDITEVVRRKREGRDVLDLEKKLARDIEWIALKQLDNFALSDMPTFFCLGDGEITLTSQYHLGPTTYPAVGHRRNRALLERLHEVLHQIPSAARTLSHRLTGFVDHYLTDEMDPGQIRAIALGEADASEQEWELDRLEWDLDPALPLDRFLDLMSAEEWKQWLWNEEQAARSDVRAGYMHLLAGKIIEPVVAVLDQKREKVVDIWDGWHRTAACFVRGENAIKAITATSYKLDHEAYPKM